MRHSRLAVFALLVPLALAGCGGGDEGGGLFRAWDGKSDSIRRRETARSMTPESLYSTGIEALQAQRWKDAVDIFDSLQAEHPYSTWATSAQLMAAYGDYQRNRYTESIGQLDRFIQLHPAHRDIAYAYYLRSLCYYEQINDAQRDQSGTVTAMNALQDVTNRFPDTAYARDARLKMDLARDHLAGREMDVGRFYEKRKLYAAAIGRFRVVVETYQTTNHVPEALHRLTEIYLALGLTDEARRTASVLGHNYPGSPWYQDSYALLVDGAEPSAPDRPGFFRRAIDWVM